MLGLKLKSSRVCVFSDELTQLRTERDEQERERERLKAEQKKLLDLEKQEHRYNMTL